MRRLVLGATLLIATATLTGCGSGQSVAAACSVSAQSRADLGSHVSDALTLMETDGNAAVVELDAAKDSATAMATGVDNVQVSDAITELIDGTTALREGLAALMLNPDIATPDDVATLTNNFTTSINSYYELCS